MVYVCVYLCSVHMCLFVCKHVMACVQRSEDNFKQSVLTTVRVPGIGHWTV